MDQVVVVVHMLIHQGRSDDAIAAFVPAIHQTLDEPGCEYCALHRDVHDPDALVLISRWDSEDDRDAILEREYIHKLTEEVSPLLAELPTIAVSREISIKERPKSLI
jgi:quinol monooxygenase YgiN